MPPRVVTADLEAIVGYPVLAVVGVPYRDGESVPGPLTNGRFLDVLVRLPPGVTDATDGPGRIYELPPQAVARLRRDDGGPLHEIWGYPRRTTPLDPGNDDDAAVLAGPRIATLTVDLGARLNARIDDVRPIGRGDGRVVAEALLESPSPNANRPAEHIFDTLDAHPSELRAVVERSPWVRRETESDPPPGWGQRKPFP